MSTNIFISYRKDDSAWNTELLYEKLTRYFPKRNLFKDFNTINLGDNYRESIERALKKCNILLVVIGKSWLTIKDADGNDRLQNPTDLVRIEIATALQRNIRVIPVLFDNIRLPNAALLPEDLKPLVLRQWILISQTNFEYDIKHLAELIQHKRINDESKISLKKILHYRIGIIVIAFTLLSLFISYLFSVYTLQLQYAIIAGLMSLMVALLVSSMLRKKIGNATRSRLQVTSIILFILFLVCATYHIFYFQDHSFAYRGFSGKSYYVKGTIYTPTGDTLKKVHPTMIDADLLQKFLGGPGKASSLWNADTIVAVKMILLLSYASIIVFASLLITLLLELLAIKYKVDD